MRKILIAAVAALALIVPTAAPASEMEPAGQCTKILGKTVCGKIKNESSSNRNLLIGKNWPSTYPRHNLSRGATSSRIWHDTDAFFAPRGCKTYKNNVQVKPNTWHKVVDNPFTYHVKVIC